MKTRRLLSSLLFLLLFAPCIYGAFSQKTAWDVQTGANDLNGGGFDTSKTSPAVDRSQSASPYVTFDGTTCTAAGTSATPTVLTISGCIPAPSAADVGNIVNITGGTHFVAGRYAITAQSGSSWTLDRNATDGTAAIGMTGRMGGALASVSTAMGMFAVAAGGVADMTIYLKSGTYGPYGNINTSIVGSQNSNRLSGYLATHGDAPSGTDRPVIQFNTGGGGNGFSINPGSTNGWIYENLILDGTGTNTVIVSASNTSFTVVNTTIRNSTGSCFQSTGPLAMSRSEVTACSGSYSIAAGAGYYSYNWLHDNANAVAVITTSSSVGTFIGNLLTNNTSQGLRVSAPAVIVGNTFYRQGTASVYMLSSAPFSGVYNNLFACSGSYGIDFISSPSQTAYQWIDNNGYHANTSGTTHYLAPGSHDVILGASGTACATNSPFAAPVSSGPGDWTLNSAVDAGARLRAAGFQGPLAGMTTKGYLDIGAYQHADAGQASCPATNASFTFVQ